MFDGPRGLLEGILTYPEHAEPLISILIVGPHPMLGGDFDNNVVRELSTRLADHQTALTLRFNYRGVGRSAGSAILSCIDQESGFAEDTAAAAWFLTSTFGSVNHVVGYSFGAWLGSQWAARTTGVESVALIAPTILHHDYSHCRQLTLPKLVIAGSDDFAVPIEELQQQFEQWSAPRKLVVEDVDSHFFRGHEAWLGETISAFL